MDSMGKGFSLPRQELEQLLPDSFFWKGVSPIPKNRRVENKT